MKSVFILGAGVMQGPAIQAAREKGYRVVVADGDESAVNAPYAQEFLHIDLKDTEALLKAARGIKGLAGVFTAGTDFSASVAYVAEALGLPGIGYEAALDASDKARMRARLAQAGVAVPLFVSGGSDDDPAALAQSLFTAGASLPLVVKPVDNMGSRGCRLARDEAELRSSWADAIAHSRSARAILEEYLDGPEFSIDALVQNGRIAIRGVADRIVTFSPYFVELGHTMPSAYGNDIIDELLRVFCDGVRALGIHSGAAKGDMKYTRKGAFVGEIAARLSGGYMSGWTYPYASAIDPASEGIDIACGVAAPLPEGPCAFVSAERAFISIPGELACLYGVAAARRLPYIKDIFLRAAPGDRLQFPMNNVQKAGNIISQAPSHELAERYAEEAARTVLLRLKPGDAETRAFLGLDGAAAAEATEATEATEHESGRYDWAPAAFKPSAMTLGYVASLPDFLKLTKPARSIGFASLPGMGGDFGRDWLGRSLQDSLALVERLCGTLPADQADIVLGRSFWNALFKGGYQAAVWLVDTVYMEYAST
jgi:biotin carboxylase